MVPALLTRMSRASVATLVRQSGDRGAVGEIDANPRNTPGRLDRALHVAALVLELGADADDIRSCFGERAGSSQARSHAGNR